MNAISDFHHHGEYARAFLAFSSCLSTFDRHPELVRSHDEQSLLWRFKWIVWQLSQFSAVPLDRALAVLDDMERRYKAGSHSLHAVYQHRALVATHLGDLDKAGHWFDEMSTARRDGLSDCGACVPTSQVEYLTARGEFEEAVRLGSPYTRGGCSEQPQQMLSQLLLPYLRTGRTGEAVEAHKSAYALIRDNRHYLELVGLHLQFCGLTGNQEHGLRIVERHLPWLERPASTYAEMEFASAAALVLHRLRESGQGDEPVRRRTEKGDRRSTTTVTETYEELAARARVLAAQFDQRNGNAHQSTRVEERLRAELIVPELPLSVLRGRPIADHPARAAVDELVARIAGLTAAGDLAAAARARLEVAFALRNAGQWGDAVETAEEAQRSLDLAGLTDEAMTARHLLVELHGRAWKQRPTAYAIMEELLAAPRLPDALPPRAELLEQAAGLVSGQPAVEHLLAAAELHREAGTGPAEARILGDVLRRTTEPPPNWSALVSRVDELAAAGILTGNDLLIAQERLCRVEALVGRHEAAVERARRHPGAHPPLRLREAGLLLHLSRFAEAEQCARPLITEEDVQWSALMIVGRSLLAQGRKPEAEAFLADHDMDLGDLEEDPDDDD
jgi:tetratricopeptide (TPR) repeat protein